MEGRLTFGLFAVFGLSTSKSLWWRYCVVWSRFQISMSVALVRMTLHRVLSNCTMDTSEIDQVAVTLAP